MKHLELVPLQEWLPALNQPLVIAGPCSAETEEQLLTTARQLKATNKVSALRAGIWKPRTRPGEFEGIGSEGLKWLAQAKAETGLPVTVEVATAKHVEEALNAGVDILWIGARTTVNPFSVQEVADALKGVDVPVLIKNPVNPDLQLWIGAIERVHRAGIRKLAAIHRGFSSFKKSSFRNEPMFDMAIALKTHFPELPVICDPSHICGNRELIPFISQRALDLDMQGLMIESHITPDLAWTDAKQQLTPTALDAMVSSLTLRRAESDNKEFQTTLEILRREIDELDDAILQKLAERMRIVEKIGEYKRDNKVTVLQVNRWEEIIERRTGYASALKLEKNFVEKLLELIHNESIRKQTEILNNKTIEA